jgi:hypothetical protein
MTLSLVSQCLARCFGDNGCGHGRKHQRHNCESDPIPSFYRIFPKA